METSLRDQSELVPQMSSGIHMRSPFQLKFDNQHGYTMVKGVYYRMIRNLQLYGGSQYLQYIHALIMDPEF